MHACVSLLVAPAGWLLLFADPFLRVCYLCFFFYVLVASLVGGRRRWLRSRLDSRPHKTSWRRSLLRYVLNHTLQTGTHV